MNYMRQVYSTGQYQTCCEFVECQKCFATRLISCIVTSQELIEIREFKDNPTLSNIATVIAVTLSAITPPDGAAQQMIDTILGVLKSTTSWRIRLHTLPLLAVLHYRQLPLLGESSNTRIMDVSRERSLQYEGFTSKDLSISRHCSLVWTTIISRSDKVLVRECQPFDNVLDPQVLTYHIRSALCGVLQCSMRSSIKVLKASITDMTWNHDPRY
jgi:hypothetical protein